VAAATFVRQISPDDQKRLAAALNLDPNLNPQAELLDAIVRAPTPKSFEPISQQIEILFGKKV